MERTNSSEKLTIGSVLPTFSLVGIDDKKYTQDYFQGAKASLVIFTCNHCPYVKGSELAMNQAIGNFLGHGLKVLAINSNDSEQYPEDSFEKMKEKTWSYPYLYDQEQSVAKSFDAACTPECYLFNADGKLAFHGTINNSPRNPDQVTQNFLMTAIEQVLSCGVATPDFAHPMGCSIKWKPKHSTFG